MYQTPDIFKTFFSDPITQLLEINGCTCKILQDVETISEAHYRAARVTNNNSTSARENSATVVIEAIRRKRNGENGRYWGDQV